MLIYNYLIILSIRRVIVLYKKRENSCINSSKFNVNVIFKLFKIVLFFLITNFSLIEKVYI